MRWGKILAFRKAMKTTVVKDVFVIHDELPFVARGYRMIKEKYRRGINLLVVAQLYSTFL